jgi:hypothetical protein
MSASKAAAEARRVGIQSRPMKLLAWLVFFAALLAAIGATVLRASMPNISDVATNSSASLGGDLLSLSVLTLATILTAGVGLVILFRSSNRQIGWLLVSFSGIAGLSLFSEQYTVYAFQVRPETILPLQWLAAWFQHFDDFIVFGLVMIVLPHLLPTGRPLSPRWRVVFWLSLVVLALITAASAFAKGPLENQLSGKGIMNPYGFIPFDDFLGKAGEQIAGSIYEGLFINFSVLAIASLGLRYWRSRGHERQQLRWIVYVLSLWTAGLIMTAFGDLSDLSLLEVLGWIILITGILGFPIAIGFAILKYRLYDIDRLINRTLVYGAVTATLALIYFSSVVLLQQLFPAKSQISIVLSTLAIAGLFSPLRRRIQNFIDRRFYRQKYDAEKVLAAFSASLRDEVDLDQLTASILEVVDETMQPAHTSLWLKPME